MKKNEYIYKSFVNAGGVFAYISALVWFIFNAEKIFGSYPGLLGPVIGLLVFIISASVTGFLVLGKPIELFISGEKRVAIQMLFTTIAWLTLFLLVLAVSLILAK